MTKVLNYNIFYYRSVIKLKVLLKSKRRIKDMDQDKQEVRNTERVLVIPTVGDLRAYVCGQERHIKLFGVDEEYFNHYTELCSFVGDAIIKEQGISKDQISVLLDCVELGKESHKRFLELQLFVLNNS